MKTIEVILREAMKKKGLGVRALEREISNQLGERHKISRNQIHEYLAGKRAPTYEAAVVLSQVLNIDKRELLLEAYTARLNWKKAAEKNRFLEFCKKEKVEINEDGI